MGRCIPLMAESNCVGKFINHGYCETKVVPFHHSADHLGLDHDDLDHVGLVLDVDDKDVGYDNDDNENTVMQKPSLNQNMNRMQYSCILFR